MLAPACSMTLWVTVAPVSWPSPRRLVTKTSLLRETARARRCRSRPTSARVASHLDRSPCIYSPPSLSPTSPPQIAWVKHTGAGQALWQVYNRPGALPVLDGWSTDDEGNVVRPTWRSQVGSPATVLRSSRSSPVRVE